MKRRTPPHDDNPTPLRLRRYDPANWPDPECHPECAFWAAVEEWREAHPPDLDGPGVLEVIDGPDAPWHPEVI